MKTNFAELNLKIFEGTAGKKVLWQPRINCWYDDKIFLKEELPGGLTGMTKPQMYDALDVSNRIYEYYGCFERITDKSVKGEWKELGGGEFLLKYSTPAGDIHAVLRNNDSNPGVYYKKWLVEAADDIKVKTYIDEATDYKYNQKTYDELYAEWGDNGAPTMYIVRTPLQEAFIETMGVENTIYALNDEPKLMEKYFAAKEESNIRHIREINKSPIRLINYGDNIHCGLTPPELYERYILPVYERRYPLLKGAGKFLFSHWDGDVKSILKYAQKTYLDGIEAITPFPQGDVSVEEIRDGLGDKMVLLDGIAALLFEDMYPLSQLEDQVCKLIEYFAGRLILGISDEMPSKGNIERVRHVRDMVNKWNAAN